MKAIILSEPLYIFSQCTLYWYYPQDCLDASGKQGKLNRPITNRSKHEKSQSIGFFVGIQMSILYILCTVIVALDVIIDNARNCSLDYHLAWLCGANLCYIAVASFTKEINQRLAKRTLFFNGRLANRWFNILGKRCHWSFGRGISRWSTTRASKKASYANKI